MFKVSPLREIEAGKPRLALTPASTPTTLTRSVSPTASRRNFLSTRLGSVLLLVVVLLGLGIGIPFAIHDQRVALAEPQATSRAREAQAYLQQGHAMLPASEMGTILPEHPRIIEDTEIVRQELSPDRRTLTVWIRVEGLPTLEKKLMVQRGAS